MSLNLNEIELRVLGCLMEKSVTTPDQYPLSLNALTNACNQKSGRNPVLALTQGEVQHTIRLLDAKHLVRVDENFKSRTEKYLQRFCNTRFSDFHFDAPQFAIVCLLFLRGPQTPGELRARSGRLHAFDDNAAVTDALKTLIEREGGPLVIKLPRVAGRQDSEYMHLFAGEIDVEEYAAMPRETATKASGLADLQSRVTALETDIALIKKQLGKTD